MKPALSPRPSAAHGLQGGGQKAPNTIAELRYENPFDAQRALKEMNGEVVNGNQVFVMADQTSKDGSKLLVTGLAPGTDWKEVKEQFSAVGPVAFCQVKSGPEGGAGGAAKGSAGLTPHPPAQAPRQVFSSGAAQSFSSGVLQGGYAKGGVGHVSHAGGGLRPNGGGCAGAQSKVGEIRFEGPDAANAVQNAIQAYSGADFNGHILEVEQDIASKDGTKVWVRNLPLAVEWQELKDMFKEIGQVAFAATKVTRS